MSASKSPNVSKVLKFDRQFQLDSKSMLNSASKLKGIKLNANVS